MITESVRKAQQKAMESTYRHRMTIYRETDTEHIDHSITTGLEVTAQNIPCLLSQNEIDKPGSGDDVNPVVVKHKLFCAPDVDLIAGDRVEIDRSTYIAGDPVRYPAHTETLLAKRDLS